MHQNYQSDSEMQGDIEANNNYEFTNKMSHNKYLYCPNCQALMMKPIRLHRCGHTFCNTCVASDKIKKCLICLKKVNIKQRDILATRLVGELEVKCLNQGCPWKGTLENYKSMHRDKCKLKEGGIEAWLKGLQEIIKDRNTNEKEQKDKCSEDQQAQRELETMHKSMLQKSSKLQMASETKDDLSKVLLASGLQ